MKRTLLAIIIQMTVYAVFAQKSEPVNIRRPEPVNPAKDKQEYGGYTIRLIPAIPMAGISNYGFDIIKDNKPVLHQVLSPLAGSSKGIQTKPDAYKIAQWMIGEYKKTGRWQTTIPVPARQDLRLESVN